MNRPLDADAFFRNVCTYVGREPRGDERGLPAQTWRVPESQPSRAGPRIGMEAVALGLRNRATRRRSGPRPA
jgi:hypothetical protein